MKRTGFLSPVSTNTNTFPFSPTGISLTHLNYTPEMAESNHNLNSLLFKQSLDSGNSNDETDTDTKLLNLLDPKYVFSTEGEVFNFTRQNSINADKGVLDDGFKYPNEQQMFAVSNDLDSLIKNNFYNSSIFNVDDYLKDDLLFDQLDKGDM